MRYNFFLMPLLVSFVISSVLLALFVLLNKQKGDADNDKRTSPRHIHFKGTSRFGGVALIVAFVSSLFLDRRLVITMPLVGVMLASGGILILGVIDDIKQLSWKWQLFLQFIIVTIVYILGVRLQYISSPFGGVFFFSEGFAYFLGLMVSIFWIIFLMNVMNWVDGVDGVSGGITLIASVTIFILSLQPEVNQPPIGIIAAALSGSLGAFLLFNFYPAKIMAGTSGSMFMGFVLAVVAIFAGAKIATTLMVLAVPIIDALWVIGERLKLKKSIFVADRRHLHYRLLELGWSARKICAFYYAITIIIATLALNMRAMGKITTLMIVILVLAVLLAVIRKKVSSEKIAYLN